MHCHIALTRFESVTGWVCGTTTTSAGETSTTTGPAGTESELIYATESMGNDNFYFLGWSASRLDTSHQ